LVWSLAASAFGYAFFQRVMPGAMAEDLMREFAIGGALLGTLSALYFYPYVFLQVPLGAMIDQIGARFLMSGALAFAAVGSVLFAVSDTLLLAYIGRTMIGIGSAVGFLGSLAIA
jgi:predicted MFS family arabinose efflux permease